MAQLKNLLVTGVSRFLNKVFADEFVGDLTGDVTGNVSGTASNVTGTVAIEHGGTNATTAANARTNLGLGSAATYTAATTVGNNSNLPTGAAVQSYVTGLGYKSSAATTSANGLMSSTDKTKLTNTNVFYGTCATAAGTAAKVVELTNGDNFELEAGAVIGVKFSASNSASNVTLNVEGTGAKSIWYNNAVVTSSSSTYCGYANRVNFYMYDGTYWVWMHPGVSLNDNTIPCAYCSTAAGTAAKAASCSGYYIEGKHYIHVIFTNTNSVSGAITLNINSRGAIPIWINGEPTSSDNHTLPRGTYIAFYDGAEYQIRTDGLIPGRTKYNIEYEDFMVETITGTTTSISGGGIGNVSFHNLGRAGYYLFNITGYNCANGNAFVLTLPSVLGKDITSEGIDLQTSVTVAFGNKSSSSISITPTIEVMYIKNKLYADGADYSEWQ